MGSWERATLRSAHRFRACSGNLGAIRLPRVLLASKGDAPWRARGARSRYDDNDAVGFIPVGDLMRELVVALGAALLIGNLAVVVRERRRTPEDVRRKPNMKLVALNIVLGAIMTAWGLGSLLTAS